MARVEVLKLDRVLGRVRNRVYRVGIELEGGWTTLPEGIQLVRDGSIHLETPQQPAPHHVPVVLDDNWIARNSLSAERRQFRETGSIPPRLQERARVLIQEGRGVLPGTLPPPQPGESAAPGLHVGELPSEPLELQKFPIWMKQYYPHQVNDSCGLHVHMSFRSALHYSRLMDSPAFQQTMIYYLARWAKQEGLRKSHPIWSRLRGKSEYCKREFFPDEQASRTSKVYDHFGVGNRYTAINYAYGMHGTVECRVLPMMETADQGIRAIQQVIDVTNACLVLSSRREEKHVAAVEEGDPQSELYTIALQPVRETREFR